MRGMEKKLVKIQEKLVSSSLDKKGGRKCDLLLDTRLNLLSPFLFNEHNTLEAG
jgi:hypothetical protein